MSWCGTKKAKKLLTMDPNSVVVFDLETTGRNPLTAEILQISMVNGNGGNLFTSYIKPKHEKTWKDAEKINHISPSMVADAPSFNEVFGQIQAIFNRAKLVVGYNSTTYDIPIIERYGIVVPANRFDLMNEFRQYTGSIKYKLADCAKYFGVSFSAHDAYEDARTTAECMEKLINSQGFVNTDPPKRKSKEKEDGDTPDRSKDKLPLQGRLLGPFLKRRRFRPLIVGIFLTIISLGYLVYQTYGPGLAGNIGKIHFSFILETAMQSKLNMCFGAVFLIGCICLAYGIPKAIVHSVRWIINLFRRILSG